MMIYHLLWDLWFLQVLPNIVLWEGFWKYFQRATATTFVLLAGASMALMAQRTPVGSEKDRRQVRGMVLRGAKIVGLGMVLTLVIRLSGIGRLDFGILHLLGLAMILAIPFRRLRWTNVVVWVVLYVLGGWMLRVDGPTLWLIPLGLAPDGYAPLDYFPLVPWFGVVLLGMGLANLLYGPEGRRFALPAWGDSAPVRLLRPLGQHSLVMYVVHQPLLWALLALLGIARLS